MDRYEEMQKLVEKFIDRGDYDNETTMQTAVTRLRNLLLRNGCMSLQDIFLRDEFRGAGKGTKSYNTILKMKEEYASEVYKRERLEEIDRYIRALSKERKEILKDLES